MFHSTYKGCHIWRHESAGYRLPWTAMTPNGQAVADTLAGVKRMITRLLAEGAPK